MRTNQEHKFQIRLQEVDHAGVMFFAHLFSHAHDAYAEMMQSMGFPLQQIIAAEEYHIPLVHAEADYTAPLRHGQLAEVRIYIESLGNSSFTLNYEFNTGDGLCARASTRHVVMDPGTGRSISIPDDLRQKLMDQDNSRAQARPPSGDRPSGRKSK
jgi:1,4-dihydroxy-2-naphthoyl-CoA hydrolase